MALPRASDPVPPALGGIVLDGSNVIASSRRRAIARLELALAWCHEWRCDLDVMVFVDHSTVMRCRPHEREELLMRCEDVTPGRARFAICPRHEPADEHVLRFARERRALVVSNDRFWDFAELRIDTVLVQFRLADDEFRVADEATWFRPPNGAVRVPMATLRALRPEPGPDGEDGDA